MTAPRREVPPVASPAGGKRQPGASGASAYPVNSPEPAFPPSAWSFDQSVTDQFNEMLERSIPQHGVMRRLTYEIGSAFVERGTDVLDLGCSRGAAIAPFVGQYGAQLRYVLCEPSESMRRAARERFVGYLERPHDPHFRLMTLTDTDIEREFPPSVTGETSLVLCVLTLQFTRIEARAPILRRAYERLRPGGALMLVEKTRCASPTLDALMVRRYHDFKYANGYSREEIARKAAALEGVMTPLSEEQNELLLKDAGFVSVECYWRWLNFAAWVAVKE